jgi:hypothetical protein
LRKKQIFTKKGGQKYTFSKKFQFSKTFQAPPNGKWTGHPLGKSYIFLASHFSPEWDREPNFKLNMDLDVLLIYRLIPRTHDLLGYIATFGTTPISRFFKASS